MKLRQLLIAAALPLTLSAQVTTTIFDEAFATGARTTFTAGTSAVWYTSAATSQVTYTPDTSITQLSSGNRQLVGYFTPQGSAVSVAVGDTLEFTFTVIFTAPADLANGFRFGLLDSSGGSRFSADNHGASATVTGYTGYGGFLNLGASATGARLYDRSTGSFSLFAAGGYAGLGTATSSQALSADVAYTGVLTLTRSSATQMDLSFNLSGGSVNYTVGATDASGAFSFDTFGFYTATGSATQFVISQAKLDYTAAAIPEPSTYAALVGLAALGLVGWRRHSRRA